MVQAVGDVAASVVGFVAASGVTALGTPLARRIAVRWQVIDTPTDTKPHHTPTPYLGGLAILVGFFVAMILTGAWREATGIAIGAAMLAIVGVVDDIRLVRASVRLLVQAGAAGVAIAAGLRVSPTSIEPLNIALTILWIVAITNAFNLLDNMNGLSAGTAGIACIAFFALAVLQHQHLVSVLAAIMAGVVVGFLPHNFPRARIFMGDAGSAPLGFIVAVIALKVRFPLDHPWSFVPPIIVLGLPLLDTTIVVLDRLRSGRPIAAAATDHCSHRLVRAGFSRVAAVSVLWGVGIVLAVLGVLGGRGIIAPAVMVGVGTAIALGVIGLALAPAVSIHTAVPAPDPDRA